MNKNLQIGLLLIFLLGIGYFTLNKQNSQPSATITKTESSASPSETIEPKITLMGTVKQLNNNSDPAQYSYELSLNSPFYDKLEATTNSPVSKMPILSRDKPLQDSLKGYVGKEIAAEGLMAWGLGESRYLEISKITDVSNWTIYTNKTFGYSLKFPVTYQVIPQTAKSISQVGLDNNAVIEKKSDTDGAGVINIDVNLDKDNLSLQDYMAHNLKVYGVTGPLVSYSFNGYSSLFNKNQPGTDLFIKQGQNIYHITATSSSTDKEVGDVLATFKFTQ